MPNKTDYARKCSIEGGFDTQKWAEAVAEMMEEKWRKERTPSSSKAKR